MGKFVTSIPVDLKPVMDNIPPGSYCYGATWNAELSRVDVVWENDKIPSKYTFPVDCPLETLIKTKAPAPPPPAAEKPKRSRG